MEGNAMKALITKRHTLCFVAFSLILVFSVGNSLAQQRYKIGGKFEFDVSTREHERIDVGDRKGHWLEWNRIMGTNKSTGAGKFMDGAQLDLMGLSDTVMGNGKHWGYLKMSIEGVSVYINFEGNILTTIASEGAPSAEGPSITYESTYADTFTIISGTGKYKDIQGAGFIRGEVTVKVEKGKLASRKAFVEWKGTYFIKK
jgi:hypothetical protein